MVAVCKSQEAAHKLDFHTLAAMADEAERRAKWEKAGGELNPDKFQNVCHKLVFWVICEVESHESKGFGKGLGISMDFRIACVPLIWTWINRLPGWQSAF